MGKTTGCVMAMFALGGVMLACVGLLMQLRMNERPIAGLSVTDSVGTVGSVPDTSGNPREPADGNIAVLASGLSATLNAAIGALIDGRRAEANEALDAARRVSQVGEAAAGEDAADAFRRASGAIARARHAIQNGRSEAAVEPLRDALGSLKMSTLARSASSRPDSRFQGATVIDATGFVIGEIEGITQHDGQHIAVIRRRGWPDFMGVLDIGGQRTEVLTSDMVFGQPRRVGGTFAALTRPR
jgi:hypothetical protein